MEKYKQDLLIGKLKTCLCVVALFATVGFIHLEHKMAGTPTNASQAITLDPNNTASWSNIISSNPTTDIIYPSGFELQRNPNDLVQSGSGEVPLSSIAGYGGTDPMGISKDPTAGLVNKLLTGGYGDPGTEAARNQESADATALWKSLNPNASGGKFDEIIPMLFTAGTSLVDPGIAAANAGLGGLQSASQGDWVNAGLNAGAAIGGGLSGGALGSTGADIGKGIGLASEAAQAGSALSSGNNLGAISPLTQIAGSGANYINNTLSGNNISGNYNSSNISGATGSDNLSGSVEGVPNISGSSDGQDNISGMDLSNLVNTTSGAGSSSLITGEGLPSNISGASGAGISGTYGSNNISGNIPSFLSRNLGSAISNSGDLAGLIAGLTGGSQPTVPGDYTYGSNYNIAQLTPAEANSVQSSGSWQDRQMYDKLQAIQQSVLSGKISQEQANQQIQAALSQQVGA